MINSIEAFLKSDTGNIIHRKNLTTGIIKVVNPNNSFDVEIGNSGKIRKGIFTLSPDPDLAVGDKARIANLHGSKEDPILLAPTKVAVGVAPLIVTLIYTGGNEYIKVYSLEGSLINTYDVTSESIYWETDCLAVDSQNNIYYMRSSGVLVKRDIDGNELKAETIAGYPESIAIGADGYLYTREQDGKVHKRDTVTYESQGYITLTSGKSYYGLCLDSGGNIYTVNYSDDEIEKWSSAGSKTASHSISNAGSDSLGLTGDYIIRAVGSGVGYSYKIHKDLGANESVFSLTNIDGQLGASSLANKYLFIGEDWGSGHYCLDKYSLGDSLDWSTQVDDLGYWDDKAAIAAYPF